MHTIKDQLNNTIVLPTKPLRIVSVVPSLTELLFDLGLDDEIVGVTKFCIHPHDMVAEKTKIGGTKNLNIQNIISLQPNIIFANKEENNKEQIEELQKHFQVFITDINTIDDAIHAINLIGNCVNKKQIASYLTLKIKEEFLKLLHPNKQSAIYLIWQNPYMTIGVDTFINSMLTIAGFKNVITKSRYPTITINDIIKLNPQYLFLSSEPYPFTQIHINEIQPFLPNTKVVLVDGEMFSWYGSRMLYACKYFLNLHASL